MGGAIFLLLIGICVGASAYLSPKDEIFGDALREVMERMGRDLDTYGEDDGRSLDTLQPEDYQDFSIRDQEYLQHSTLEANQYRDDDDGMIRIKPGDNVMKVQSDYGKEKLGKQENTLPAYCNPPNPCPIGYSVSDGCLEEFENTAEFSRKYQEAQDCMCDTEHMYDCSNTKVEHNPLNELDRLVQQFQMEDEHKSLVAKKFHQKKSVNPYLVGERLPVAAKKGFGIE